MSYGTYLFDLDGTLLDTVELILSSHRHTRRVHFGDTLPDSEYIATMGRTLRDTFTDMAGTRSDIEAMVATYREFNHTHHDEMVRPYPGVREMLATLRDRGVRLAVVTSKARALALRGLQVGGLQEFFSTVVGGDDVVRGKPDPLPVATALQALGAQPEEALMVGDSTHDIAAGRGARVATAAVLWGPFSRVVLEASGPDYYVQAAREIPMLAPTRG